MLHGFDGKYPTVHNDAYIVDSAQIIGDVVIGKESSVWFNVVIRGDVNYIRIGERTNIQDCSVVHVRHERYPCIIGSNITVGHGAILHACTIADNCLIGMGAIILDNARIQRYTLVAAGTVVRNDAEFPEGMLIAGVPGRAVRALTDEERKSIDESAGNYIAYTKSYRITS